MIQIMQIMWSAGVLAFVALIVWLIFFKHDKPAATVEHKYATVAGAISADEDVATLKWLNENWTAESRQEYAEELDRIWRGRITTANCALRPLVYRVGDYTTAMRNVQVGWLGGGS